MLYEPLHVKLEGTVSYLLAVSHSLECPDNFFSSVPKAACCQQVFLVPLHYPICCFQSLSQHSGVFCFPNEVHRVL